jgi:hypothetical protein
MRGLVRQQRVEGPIPALPPRQIDPDAPARFPLGHDPAAAPVADEIGLQPGGQARLALRVAPPVGDEHQDAIGQRQALAPAPPVVAGIEDRLEPQFPPERSRHQPRSPARGLLSLHGRAGRSRRRHRVVPAPQAHQGIEMRGQPIVATEVGDDALLSLTVLPVRFDEPDVLVGEAGAAAGPDRAQVHTLSRVIRESHTVLSSRIWSQGRVSSVTRIRCPAVPQIRYFAYLGEAPRRGMSNMG